MTTQYFGNNDLSQFHRLTGKAITLVGNSGDASSITAGVGVAGTTVAGGLTGASSSLIAGQGGAAGPGGVIDSIDVNPTAGGTGYTLNDILTITTGDGTATLKVTGETGGVVDNLSLVTRGTGYSTGTGQATSGGTGTGCTAAILSIRVLSPGLGGDVVIRAGQGGSGSSSDASATGGNIYLQAGAHGSNGGAGVGDAGQVIVPSLSAFGDTGTAGIVSNVMRFQDIAWTVTDFTPTNSWRVSSCRFIVDPNNDYTSDAATAHYAQVIVQNGNANDFGTLIGSNSLAQHFGTGAVDTIVAHNIAATLSDAGTITTCVGANVQSLAGAGSAGTIASAYGIVFVSGCQDASSAVTNNYPILIRSPRIDGPVSVHRGIYAESQTGATTSHFIYSEGGQSYHSGNLGLGNTNTTPAEVLDVLGNAKVKGNLLLYGATSGFVGIAPAAAAGGTTYTLPSADGTAGQTLTTNGSATLSWSGGTSQSGTATLTAGTVTISTANISASSSILVTIKDASPGTGNLTVGLAVPVASRSVGTPGSFDVRANIADGTINVLDTSTFDWTVIN